MTPARALAPWWRRLAALLRVTWITPTCSDCGESASVIDGEAVLQCVCEIHSEHARIDADLRGIRRRLPVLMPRPGDGIPCSR